MANDPVGESCYKSTSHKFLEVIEMSFKAWGRAATDEISRSTCFAWMDLNHDKFTREKMIDICCVGSSVKYLLLSYWSIVLTSPVEFSTGELWSPSKWHNQPGKNKRLIECLAVGQKRKETASFKRRQYPNSFQDLTALFALQRGVFVPCDRFVQRAHKSKS